jgi:hypothetical protein
MRTTLCTCLAALAVATLAQTARADEPKRPEPARPEAARHDPARAEAWFRQLDKNHDGALEPEELPPRMKEALEKMDKNRDKKIDLPEFMEATRHFAEHRGRMGPPGGPRGPQQPKGEGPTAQGPRPQHQGPPPAWHRPPCDGPRDWQAGRGDWRRPPLDGPRHWMPEHGDWRRPPFDGPRDWLAARPDWRRPCYDGPRDWDRAPCERPRDWDRRPYERRGEWYGPHRGYGPCEHCARAWHEGRHYDARPPFGAGCPCPWCRHAYGRPGGLERGREWGHHRPPMGRPEARGPRPPMGPPGGPAVAMRMPDPKEIFKRLDADHDGKLSLEEFTAGMKRFHAMLTERLRGRPAGPEGGRHEMAQGLHPRHEAAGPTAGAEKAHKGHEATRARHHDMAKQRPAKPEKPAKPDKPEKPEPGAKPEAKKA